MKVTVKPIDGVPVIHIDGIPNAGDMYWRGTISADEARMFGEKGVNIFSFNSQLWIGDSPDGSPAVYYDGMLPFPAGTPERMDKAMAEILKGNPRALVMPRFRVIAPLWWCDRHPEEMMRFYDIHAEKMVKGYLPAVDSDVWWEAVRQGLSDIVRHCEEKWGDHILAYHTGMGCCAEHAYAWGDYIAEYSQPHLRHFRGWLKRKYGTDAALQAAWRCPEATLATADFPAPERYMSFHDRHRVFFSPEEEAALIDHQTFNSEAMAEAVAYQAHVVKDTLRSLGSEKLFCAFYGYLDIAAGRYAKYAHGHDGQDIVLNCDDIDIICAPLNYSTRQEGGGVNAQLLPGSMIAHNKVYYAEDDTGTHKAQAGHHGYIARTAEESVRLLRRNFLATLAAGGNQWWMDLRSQDWYHDPMIMDEVAWQRRFAERHLRHRASRAEIAVFVSEASRNYDVIFPIWYMGMAVEQQINEISAIGAPYDVFRLEDLPLLADSGRLKQYKFAIMLNATVIDSELADCLKRHLLADNRTILWFYMPGYVRDRKESPEHTRDLTGLRLNCLKQSGCKSMLTETWLDGVRLCYGPTRSAEPRFVCSDEETGERLGYYVEGTIAAVPQNGDGASLVSRKMPWGRSIWSSAANMPSCLLGRFAAEAGVRIYSAGNPVWVGSDWLLVHAKRNGVHVVHLPDKDVTLNLKRGENALFEVGWER